MAKIEIQNVVKDWAKANVPKNQLDQFNSDLHKFSSQVNEFSAKQRNARIDDDDSTKYEVQRILYKQNIDGILKGYNNLVKGAFYHALNVSNTNYNSKISNRQTDNDLHDSLTSESKILNNLMDPKVYANICRNAMNYLSAYSGDIEFEKPLEKSKIEREIIETKPLTGLDKLREELQAINKKPASKSVAQSKEDNLPHIKRRISFSDEHSVRKFDKASSLTESYYNDKKVSLPSLSNSSTSSSQNRTSLPSIGKTQSSHSQNRTPSVNANRGNSISSLPKIDGRH